MEKRDCGSLSLAVGGTLIVSVAWLAPVIFGGVTLFTERVIRFDYLMPAEVFPIVLIGEGFLLWASIRLRKMVRTFGWILGLSLLFLISSQGIGVISGLASGRIPPQGWQWSLTIMLLIGYDIMVIAASIMGIRLNGSLVKTGRVA